MNKELEKLKECAETLELMTKVVSNSLKIMHETSKDLIDNVNDLLRIDTKNV